MNRISYSTYKEDRDGYKSIPYTTGSDYSGDSVTRSNYLEIKKALSEYDGIYDCYGDYSTYALWYRPDELTTNAKEKIDEIIKGLESYPCYDDDALSELEWTIIMDYVNDDGIKYDFPRAIGHHNDDFLDWLSNRGINWQKVLNEIVGESIGDWAIIEEGCVPYINWDKVAVSFRATLNSTP
jgi:hypothetical protein